MLDPKRKEFNWLGAEALPAGLNEINGAIRAWTGVTTPSFRMPAQESRPTGLIAIAARWMQRATRLN